MSYAAVYSPLPNEYELQAPPSYVATDSVGAYTLANTAVAPVYVLAHPLTVVQTPQVAITPSTSDVESLAHDNPQLAPHPHYSFMMWSSIAVALSLLAAIVVDVVFSWRHFMWYRHSPLVWIIYITIPVLPLYFLANLAQIGAACNRKRSWLLHAARLSVFLCGICSFCLILSFAFLHNKRWRTAIPLVFTFIAQFCFTVFSLKHLHTVQPHSHLLSL